MGYTHYWTMTENIKSNDWKRFADFAKRAVKEMQGQTTFTAGGFYGDEGIHIVGYLGEAGTSPTFDTKSVSFNGLEKQGHESFYIAKNDPEAWEFCKTARKPYDVVVVACLIAAKMFRVIDNWQSDGNNLDHKEGINLYHQIEDS